MGGDGGADQGLRVDAAATAGSGWHDGGADQGLHVDAAATAGGGWRRQGKVVKAAVVAGGDYLSMSCVEDFFSGRYHQGRRDLLARSRHIVDLPPLSSQDLWLY